MSIYEYDEERQRRLDREEGMEAGMEVGMEAGIERFAELASILLKENRMDDLKRATEDKEYCKVLMKELLKL